MRSHHFCFLLVVLNLLLGAAASSVGRTTFDFESSTREEILATREKRKKQIQGLLDDAKKQRLAHTSGKKVLGDEDLKSLEQKIHVYERKLETMEGEMDEREVERILKREELRFQRDDERRRRREREEL